MANQYHHQYCTSNTGAIVTVKLTVASVPPPGRPTDVVVLGIPGGIAKLKLYLVTLAYGSTCKGSSLVDPHMLSCWYNREYTRFY